MKQKTLKTKVRKGLQAMKTRQHKNKMRADKAKPFFDLWLEQRFEEMK